MYPNHAYSTAKSWYTDYRGRDSAVWCGTCHPSKVDESLGGQYHNHPTACDYCHGNPATAGGRSDFPHTSENSMLLKNYPDALCTTCHTKGSLPHPERSEEHTP